MKRLSMKKNDGTDVKKNDGNVNATRRACNIRITNKTGKLLTEVKLIHTSGDKDTTVYMPQLKNNTSSYEESIIYETGACADFDYWNVSFHIGTDVYDTPWNDRCNITNGDAGQLVDCVLTHRSGDDYDLETQMPKSGNCNFIIEKK